MGRRRALPPLDPSSLIQLDIENGLCVVARLVGEANESRDGRSPLPSALRQLQAKMDRYGNALRLIELDPTRYSLSAEDLLARRTFLLSAREFLREVQPNLQSQSHHSQGLNTMATGGGYRYSRLEQEEGAESSSSANVNDLLMKQERIIRQQDDDLELVGTSMHTLKNMSSRIGQELEQQSIMLDELGEDMERVDSKLDGAMKKIAKLAHLEDGNRQCKAIIILSILLFFLVFMLIIL